MKKALDVYKLLKDYEDYLRVRNLPIWDRQHPRYERMREYARGEQIRKEYSGLVARMSDEEIANFCITLIHQATYMLHRLLITMQDRFVKEGGIKERMFRSRMAYRSNQGNLSNLNNRSNLSNQNNRSNLNNQNNQNSLNSPNDSKKNKI